MASGMHVRDIFNCAATVGLIVGGLCGTGQCQSNARFTSYHEGKAYDFVITKDELAKTPAWHDREQNPPLSAQQAKLTATNYLKKLFVDADHWSLGEVALHPVLDRWIYPKPAIETGEEYFSRLQRNELDGAFAMYTLVFQQRAGEDWRKVITQLDTQAGRITDFKSVGATLAPVTRNDSTVVACVLARYQVKRGSLSSEEKLIVCPYPGGAGWGIAGHEIIRSDTQQHFAAGITVHEETIFRTN